MPKKKNPETPQEQSARFKKEAKRLIEAGEFNLAEGERALDDLVKRETRSR